MSASWQTKWRWHTTLSADSVEWCPVEAYARVLVCGTYQLDKNEKGEPVRESSKQKRLGRIYLFEITAETTNLPPSFTVETPGILDQKWCYHTIQGRPILAVVTSNGTLRLYRLLDEGGTLSLDMWLEEAVVENGLALAVDWSSNKLVSSDTKLVVSDSLGNVTLFRIQDQLEKVGVWQAHTYEAWTCAFDYWNPDVFYTGGDDSLLKWFDCRAAATAGSYRHEAGVTAVRAHLHTRDLLSGSYDEKIRLWDGRSLKRPVTECHAGGGLWRLKWHPSRKDSLLAACMYGGFRLFTLDNQHFEVLAEYLEHESIAYGADWSFGAERSRAIVATCSFYDCQMHISEIVYK